MLACAKRLSPRRRYVERAGGPEFIDGNQVRAVGIRLTCDGFKDGI
jgi:hypothetical protein